MVRGCIDGKRLRGAGPAPPHAAAGPGGQGDSAVPILEGPATPLGGPLPARFFAWGCTAAGAFPVKKGL